MSMVVDWFRGLSVGQFFGVEVLSLVAVLVGCVGVGISGGVGGWLLVFVGCVGFGFVFLQME